MKEVRHVKISAYHVLAVLVVVIAAVAAYSALQKGTEETTASGFTFIRPTTWNLNHATGNLTIMLTAEEPLILYSIEAGEATLSVEAENINMVAGGTREFSIENTGKMGNAGDRYTLHVEIRYLCLEEYENEESKGTIKGKLV